MQRCACRHFGTLTQTTVSINGSCLQCVSKRTYNYHWITLIQKKIKTWWFSGIFLLFLILFIYLYVYSIIYVTIISSLVFHWMTICFDFFQFQFKSEFIFRLLLCWRDVLQPCKIHFDSKLIRNNWIYLNSTSNLMFDWN